MLLEMFSKPKNSKKLPFGQLVDTRQVAPQALIIKSVPNYKPVVNIKPYVVHFYWKNGRFQFS